jgi:hypothetical protein
MTLEHLSFPAVYEAPTSTSGPAAPQARPLLRDRLYVGNLHPTIDE